jgi:hypothetical protein
MTIGCAFFGHFGRAHEAKTSKNVTLFLRDALRVEQTYGRGVRDLFGTVDLDAFFFGTALVALARSAGVTAVRLVVETLRPSSSNVATASDRVQSLATAHSSTRARTSFGTRADSAGCSPVRGLPRPRFFSSTDIDCAMIIVYRKCGPMARLQPRHRP